MIIYVLLTNSEWVGGVSPNFNDVFERGEKHSSYEFQIEMWDATENKRLDVALFQRFSDDGDWYLMGISELSTQWIPKEYLQ